MEKDAKAYGNIFFAKRKEKESHPDARGDFTVRRDLLEELTAALRESDEVKVSFAGWKKVGPKSGTYLSANLSIARNRKPEAANEDNDDEDGALWL